MADVQVLLRSPQAYEFAQKALDEMQRCKVWPTPTNFEIWLNVLSDPKSPLATDLDALRNAGTHITEALSSELAAKHLPGGRLDHKIQDTSEHIDRQLRSITNTLEAAQASNETYGQTLAGATKELEQAGSPALKKLVERLTQATLRIHQENSALESKLRASTDEVRSLQTDLEQVRRDSMTDALTGLPNRKALNDKLGPLLQETEAAGQPLTVAIADIDHFKRFNDTWGHQTGDQVLRYVASVLGRVAEAPRIAARQGGEEFAVVFPGETAMTAVRIMDGARTEVSSRTLKRRSTNEDLGIVTVSAGVAQRRPGETLSAFLARADAALYASKRGGRDRVTSAESPAPAAAA